MILKMEDYDLLLLIVKFVWSMGYDLFLFLVGSEGEFKKAFKASGPVQVGYDPVYYQCLLHSLEQPGHLKL